MRKNPFSLYDFLGYVFPGALALVLICFFKQAEPVHSISQLSNDLGKYVKDGNTSGTFDIIEGTVVLTITSYIIGHIVAYLSSVTVEMFAIWLYGYPSKFLFKRAESWHYWRFGNVKNDLSEYDKVMQIIWRIIIGIFLFPISLCSVLLGKFLYIKNFFVKPLDNTLQDAIKQNQDKLAKSLGIKLDPNSDFHRVIYHYEYERQNVHTAKLDNYVALYGFLRAMTFITNCATIWIFIKYVIPTFPKGGTIDWHLAILGCICILLTYTFFMAFMKFYRRFTLESFMCLVIDTSFKEVEIIPYNYSYLSEQKNSNYNPTNNYESFTSTTVSINTVSEVIENKDIKIT